VKFIIKYLQSAPYQTIEFFQCVVTPISIYFSSTIQNPVTNHFDFVVNIYYVLRLIFVIIYLKIAQSGVTFQVSTFASMVSIPRGM